MKRILLVLLLSLTLSLTGCQEKHDYTNELKEAGWTCDSDTCVFQINKTVYNESDYNDLFTTSVIDDTYEYDISKGVFKVILSHKTYLNIGSVIEASETAGNITLTTEETIEEEYIVTYNPNTDDATYKVTVISSVESRLKDFYQYPISYFSREVTIGYVNDKIVCDEVEEDVCNQMYQEMTYLIIALKDNYNN